MSNVSEQCETILAVDDSANTVGTAEVRQSEIGGTTVSSLTIQGLGGNDTITADASLLELTSAITLDGGDGNDVLNGCAGGQWIMGGTGKGVIPASAAWPRFPHYCGVPQENGRSSRRRPGCQSTAAGQKRSAEFKSFTPIGGIPAAEYAAIVEADEKLTGQ